MTVRERRAFSTAGSRKAFTPLLTASTPVNAVQAAGENFQQQPVADGFEVCARGHRQRSQRYRMTRR